MLSGEPGTNLIDTILSILAHIIVYAKQHKCTYLAALRAIVLIVTGDDSVLGYKIKPNFEQVLKDYAALGLPATGGVSDSIYDVEFCSAFWIDIQEVSVEVDGEVYLVSHCLSQKVGRAFSRFGLTTKTHLAGDTNKARRNRLAYLKGKAECLALDTGSTLCRTFYHRVIELIDDEVVGDYRHDNPYRVFNKVKFECKATSDAEKRRYSLTNEQYLAYTKYIAAIPSLYVVLEDGGMFDVDF
jgi:hypothetical protein